MSNCCYTVISLKGSHEDLVKIETVIKRASKRKDVSEYGDWLGNILPYVGYSCKQVENATIDDCGYRGKVLTHRFTAFNELTIDTETAWTPCLRIFKKLVDKYAPGSAMYYTTEEPMALGYVTNIPEIAKKHKDYEFGDISDFL